jgi:arylsulfatase A-like enzyme
MLTGLLPAHHGAIANGIRLHRGAVSLPDVLSREGYRTAAFISGWTLKNDASGLAARFNYYDEDFSRWTWLPEVLHKLPIVQQFITVASMAGYYQDPLERIGEKITNRAVRWLKRNRDQRFFLFVHYFDPHFPYEPPAPYDRMHDPDYQGDQTKFRRYQRLDVQRHILSDSRHVQHMKALYEGEISYVDSQIGRVLSALQELGLANDTLVIFTADHGESLTEHNFFFDHGEYLYDTCVRVPLLIRFPHQRYAGLKKPNQVSLVDLAPTILEVAGVRKKISFDGRSLMPIIKGSETQERVSFGSIHTLKDEDSRSRYYVREKGYKLIWNFDAREPFSRIPVYEELYDLNSDSGEVHNIVSQKPEVLEVLRKDLGSLFRNSPTKTEGLSEEVKERLRALGYL